jgi:ribose/xylose/arabinose/galactoside ABC-type transport system permease subunit
VPVPLSETVCGEPEALSATLSVAVKLEADAGVKVTLMEQLALAANDAPQLLVCAKFDGFAPVIEMLLMVSGAVPVFANIAVCATLVVPLVEAKLSVPGVSDACGAVACVTLKVAAGALPPPGAGFTTVTGTDPTVATSAAVIAAVSCDALT